MAQTITAWLKVAKKQLLEAGIDSARLDALLLLENGLNETREWVLAHIDEPLPAVITEDLNKKLLQRLEHTPLAYIIGSKEFYGREFKVTEDVLIPRPESEDMIELLLSNSGLDHVSSQMRSGVGGRSLLDPQIKSVDDNPFLVLDIGTGSGVLAITVQLEIPSATVVATDISKQALDIARSNAANLRASVQFHKANLLDLPTAIKPRVILANLPYVPKDLITSEEITKEPALAIFSGADGLDLYGTFWQQLANFSPQPMFIVTESLENQHDDMVKLAKIVHYELEETKGLAQLFKSAD